MNFIIDGASAFFDFCNVAFVSQEPVWHTDHQIVHSNVGGDLLSFGGNSQGDIVLIVPPQAGHHSCIADFAERQSLVETLLPLAQVFAVEWKPADLGRKDETVDNLICQLDDFANFLGGKVHLIGLCQGGWLSAMFAALFPEKVSSLMLGAAPIDFRVGNSKVKKMVDEMPMDLYRFLVEMGGGLLRGDVMLTGWKNTNPHDRYISDYLDILLAVGDETKMSRIKKFRTWYEYVQDISGAWYLQVVKQLFKENKLISGDFLTNWGKVDLSNISCPVAMLAGEKDDVTPWEQVYALADHVSTPVEQQFKATIPGCGHIGVFMKKESQYYWIEAFNFCTNGNAALAA